MQTGYLFDTPILYSPRPIPREDVPQGWHCCDLCGTAKAPDVPYKLVDQAERNYAGSILSNQPLKNDKAQSRLLKDAFWLSGEFATLDEFCMNESIPLPQTPIRHLMRPASPEEAELFYALSPEQNEEQGAIGHVRIDFGQSGEEFWHTWWPRGPEELNTPEFRAELAEVVNDFRKGVLKDLLSMERYCWGSDGAIKGGSCCQNYGFTLESARYIYRLRCNPIRGDYQAYLACFDREAQKLTHDLSMEMGGMG